MSCPNCGNHHTDTIDSRPTKPWRIRRKRCRMCSHRWSTYEVPADQLEGMVELRYLVTQAKEHITKLEQTLLGIPMTRETCNGSEHSETGMGQAA